MPSTWLVIRMHLAHAKSFKQNRTCADENENKGHNVVSLYNEGCKFALASVWLCILLEILLLLTIS